MSEIDVSFRLRLHDLMETTLISEQALYDQEVWFAQIIGLPLTDEEKEYQQQVPRPLPEHRQNDLTSITSRMHHLTVVGIQTRQRISALQHKIRVHTLVLAGIHLMDELPDPAPAASRPDEADSPTASSVQPGQLFSTDEPFDS